MKYFLYFLILFSFILSSISAQIQVNLSGTIETQGEFPAKDIVVALKDNSFKDTTNENGEFEVIGEITPIVNSYEVNKPKIRCNGANFKLIVPEGGQQISLDIYNVKGAKVASILRNKVFSEGQHSIPVFQNLNDVSSSVLVAVVKRGSDMSKFRIVKIGGNSYIVRDFNSLGSTTQSYQTSRLALALDSLTFTRYRTVEGEDKVLREFSFPVTKWIDKFEVVLDMIPYEAIEWGKTQVGRSNETVGEELGTAPNGTYPYEFQTYYNGAWCSEFYSYMMRVGGYPLGDDEGSATRPNWLHLGHDGLERWFTSNSDQETEFVKQEDIVSSGYVPVTGDFVHVGGHTTAVRYVDDSDILYTLGGNEGDKVKLATRGNYVNWSSTLWGYGRRTCVLGCSYKSISE
jgi:hypothetical protein